MLSAKRRVLAIAVCALAGLGGAAPGQAQTQIELNQQAGAVYKEVDGKLNNSYAKLSARLSPTSKSRLQAAQEAWARYRDLECAFIGTATEGGTIQSTMITQCKTELTTRRLKDIDAQLNCEEGDLVCVRN